MICLMMESCKSRLLWQGPLSCQPMLNHAADTENRTCTLYMIIAQIMDDMQGQYSSQGTHAFSLVFTVP
jgi:hypothetical protein